jgi:hypothetical protein
MSNKIKISELSAYPFPFAENDSVIPVVALGNTYRLPVSAIAPEIEFESSATLLGSDDFPYATVEIDPEIRNKFTLDFGIPRGLDGTSPEVSATVVSTEALEPSVEVIGTLEKPIFAFSLPKGSEGSIGATPEISATVTIIDQNEEPFVTKSGTNEEPLLNFFIPEGPQGNPGVGISFKGRRDTKADLNAVESPSTGDAWFVTNDESFTPPASSVFYVYGLDGQNNLVWLSGGALQGPAGANGLNATIVEVSAVSGAFVNIEQYGTPNQSKFKFTIPPGARGPSGDWTTPQVIKTITSANYTLTATDAGSLIIIDTPSDIASPFQLRVPTTAGNFLSGQKVDFIRTGTAQVSCVAVTGATVNGTPGLKLRDRYSAASAIYIADNQWIVVGDLDS